MISFFCTDIIKEVSKFSIVGLLSNDFLHSKKFIFPGVRHLHLLFLLSVPHHFKVMYGLHIYTHSLRVVFLISLFCYIRQWM